MENLNEPEKIRQLFSSFISNLNNERCSKGSQKDKGKDDTLTNSSLGSCITDQQKDTDNDNSTGAKKNDAIDSRNKIEFYQRVETYSPVTWCAKPMNLSPLVCARYGWVNVDVDMLQCRHCGAFLCGQLPKNVGSQNFTWCAKPLNLSPLVCARYGWVNVDVDMLQCRHCGAFLCGQLPKNVGSQIYKDSCNKLKRNLQDSHEKLCKWSSTPSPEIFTQVPCVSRGQVLKDFCGRVTSLESIEDRLPDISYSSMVGQSDEMKLSEARLHEVVEKITSYLNESNIKCTEKTVMYSVTGWAYQESQKGIQVLWCNFCCRKVGLWNYHSLDTVNNSVNDETTANGEPVLKKQKKSHTSFDPVSGHRYWCPWIQNKVLPDTNQSSFSPQSSPLKSPSLSASDDLSASPFKHTSLPTWHHIALILSKHVHLDGEEDFLRHIKQSPQVEGLRHIRQVLRDCTSPPTPKLPLFSGLSPENIH